MVTNDLLFKELVGIGVGISVGGVGGTPENVGVDEGRVIDGIGVGSLVG